jgi:hypothetical protein
MAFLAFRQKKPFNKTFKKDHISAASTRLLAPEGKIEKKYNRFGKIQTFYQTSTKQQNFPM